MIVAFQDQPIGMQTDGVDEDDGLADGRTSGGVDEQVERRAQCEEPDTESG